LNNDEAGTGFTIRSDSDWLSIRLEEVFGFPDKTSFRGGYDARGILDLRRGIFSVRVEPFWLSTGEIWQFAEEPRQAYRDLAGQARFRSSEDQLALTLAFPPNPWGHWALEGTCWPEPDSITKLVFEMSADQSYLAETLAELDAIVAEYGDNRGRRQ
jgi:hypothetical protein